MLFPINNTFPFFERVFCDAIQRNQVFNAIQKDTKIIGGGSFLTEFGVCALCYDNGTCLTSECETILESSDQYFMSWSYGDSNFYTIDGNFNYPIINIFARVYPQSTSGKPISLFYDPKSLLFSYKYEHDPSINEPTEIYIPKFLYSTEFQVTVSEHLQYYFDNKTLLLLITVSDMWKEPFQASIIVQKANTKF